MSEGTIGQAVRTDAQPAPQVTPPALRHKPAQDADSSRAASVQSESPAKPAQPEAEAKVREQISLDELSEMLNKLNLTFDLFEIEAEFSFDREDKQVRVVVRNTRTNEVIRRIPAHEFQAQFSNFRDGVGMLVDSFL